MKTAQNSFQRKGLHSPALLTWVDATLVRCFCLARTAGRHRRVQAIGMCVDSALVPSFIHWLDSRSKSQNSAARCGFMLHSFSQLSTQCGLKSALQRLPAPASSAALAPLPQTALPHPSLIRLNIPGSPNLRPKRRVDKRSSARYMSSGLARCKRSGPAAESSGNRRCAPLRFPPGVALLPPASPACR